MRKLKTVLANKCYSCYLNFLFLLFIGYLTVHIQFSTNLKYHGDEKDHEKLLKLVINQKILTSGVKNHSKKCYEQNGQYNVSINGETYPKKVPLLYNTSIDFECLKQQNKDIKIILSWNDHFGLKFDKKMCPVNNCEFTFDRRLQQYASYVIFHGPDFNTAENLPPKNLPRPSFQRWIFSSFESPMNTQRLNGITQNYNGYFNMTATYLSGSDFDNIYELQSGFKWEKNIHYDPSQDFTVNKTGLVAALISNCVTHDHSNRLLYLQELKRTTQVDVYGKCGRPCPKTNRYGAQIDNCRDFLLEEYLFFFAAENSMCKDYITEKFFLAIRHNVVPIVLGGGDYKKFIPKSGFINALDFPTASKLGDYLDYLKGNKTAYGDFFKWKQHVKFEATSPNIVCTMCIKLNLEEQFGIQQNIVRDLDTYWNPRDCKIPRTEAMIVFKYDENTYLNPPSQYMISLFQLFDNQIFGYVLILLVLLAFAFFYIKRRKS